MSKVFEAASRFDLEGFVSAHQQNHDDFILAASVGAVAAFVACASSEKATAASTIITGVAGAAYVLGVANEPKFGFHESTASNMAIVGGVAFATTGLIGYVSNSIFGSKGNNNELTEL